MVEQTTIIANNGKQAQEGFVEEAQNEQQYQTYEAQGQDGHKLRGRGLIGVLEGAATLLGTVAAVGGTMRRPYHRGYGFGMKSMMPPPPPMMHSSMMGPHMEMMRGHDVVV